MNDTRLALFIPDLSAGGSERQLVGLARGLSESRRPPLIITMYDGGAFFDEASRIPDVRVIALRKRSHLVFLLRLVSVIRRERVRTLYAFLATAQAYSLMAKLFVPGVKLVFRVGDAIGPSEKFDGKDALVDRVLRVFRRVPERFVLNSEAGRAAKASALPLGRLSVIPNGIDTARFQPNLTARDEFRHLMGAGAATVVIGCVGNFSIYKDHRTFIEAAALVRRECEGVHFLAIGNDRTTLGREARAQVDAAGMTLSFTFAGPQRDIERIMPACDVGCSSSITEGFPNAVAEFMACGIPCVVTDAGDSRLIVGDTGRWAPRADARSLADGILALARLSPPERRALGDRARRRIVKHFSMTRMVSETEALLATV